MIKTVIWDWNGTLLADMSIGFETINRLLQAHDYPPLPGLDYYKEIFCFPIIKYYINCGIDFKRTPFEQMAAEYMDLYLPAAENCPLQPDSENVLKMIKESGLREILLSASKQEHLEQQLASYPISSYFDEVLGISDFYAASKTDIALNYFKNTGANPKEAVFVGDSTHDFEVASACGSPCILFAGGHFSRHRLEDTGCIVIDRLTELPSAIERLNAR